MVLWSICHVTDWEDEGSNLAFAGYHQFSRKWEAFFEASISFVYFSLINKRAPIGDNIKIK